MGEKSQLFRKGERAAKLSAAVLLVSSVLEFIIGFICLTENLDAAFG